LHALAKLLDRKEFPLNTVSRDDVVKAAARISGCVERTPLLETRISGHTLWL
jgi:hypothetical protein